MTPEQEAQLLEALNPRARQPLAYISTKGGAGNIPKVDFVRSIQMAMLEKTIKIQRLTEDAMATTPTHYKYQCRICQKEHLQPVLPDAPEKTPIPRCCGGNRDMAFKGHHNE